MRKSIRRHLPYVFTVDESLAGGIATLLGGVVGVDSLDVGDHDKDTARKDKQKGHDAQHTDSIESKEDVCMRDEQKTRRVGMCTYRRVRWVP